MKLIWCIHSLLVEYKNFIWLPRRRPKGQKMMNEMYYLVKKQKFYPRQLQVVRFTLGFSGKATGNLSPLGQFPEE